jgi:hypothetical protein
VLSDELNHDVAGLPVRRGVIELGRGSAVHAARELDVLHEKEGSPAEDPGVLTGRGLRIGYVVGDLHGAQRVE